jgi:DNA-binding MarR family transcriptional regulator
MGNKKLDPKTDGPGTERLFRSYLRTWGLLRQVMDPYFAQFGISGPQWGILRILHRAELEGESGLRLKDVGARLLVQPPSVTGLVDRLERQGLLKRNDSKADLRVRRVSLTPEARKLVERVLVGHTQQIKRLFEPFESQEVEQFVNFVKRWEAHLDELVMRKQGGGDLVRIIQH